MEYFVFVKASGEKWRQCSCAFTDKFEAEQYKSDLEIDHEAEFKVMGG